MTYKSDPIGKFFYNLFKPGMDKGKLPPGSLLRISLVQRIVYSKLK
ncbi:MAG: hypothetical protein WCP85_27230 [Mariniphaga sp.]